jgi:hypothetical protein
MRIPLVLDGTYAIPDPDEPRRPTYWRVTNGKIQPWPSGAKYGPPRPPLTDPRPDPAIRAAQLAVWRTDIKQHRLRVIAAINADAPGAAARFTAGTERCSHCRRFFKQADLQPDGTQQ